MSSSRQKVGIYSGAFDPVHQGHIDFAKAAAEYADLDKVFFLVEPRPRHKQGVKALEHRIAMVKLAIRHEPRLGVIILEQPRFNVPETWPQIEARFQDAQLFMLLGDDVFRRLSHWPYLQSLAKSTRFIVGLRKSTSDELSQYMKELQKTRHVRLGFASFQATHHQLSSRVIRHELKQGKEPKGLDKSVQRYIASQRLYSDSSE